MSGVGITYLWPNKKFPPFIRLEGKRGDYEVYTPERTCRVVKSEPCGQMWVYCHEFSCDCGQRNLFTTESQPPRHCPNCGKRVRKKVDE